MDEFKKESMSHGWPSFRDSEVTACPTHLLASSISRPIKSVNQVRRTSFLALSHAPSTTPYSNSNPRLAPLIASARRLCGTMCAAWTTARP